VAAVFAEERSDYVSWFRKFRQGFKWRLCSPAA